MEQRDNNDKNNTKINPSLHTFFFGIAAWLLINTKESPEQKEEEKPAQIVDVVKVEQQTVSLNLPSYGVVTPKNKTQLVTEVKGRLLSISPNFVAGGVVKKGSSSP